MIIRKGSLSDLDMVSAVEGQCFPPAEAASRESFRERLTYFPQCFWVMEEKGQIIAFINGMTTDEENLADEMYSGAKFYKPDGKWLMLFGVDTVPQYRRHGIAARLMEQVIFDSRRDGRRGICLTAKDHMVHYYEKFGFVSEGLSDSSHGGAVWYQMRLTFEK